MDDIVARYTLKFNDLASRGLLRAAGAARAFSIAGTAAIAGIGALSVATIALGKKVFDLSTNWANLYDDLGETADKAGISAGYLRNLQMAMGDMGVEQGTLNKGLIKFKQNLGKIKDGGIPKALNAYGDSFKFLTDSSIAVEPALKKAFDALAKIEDPARRSAAGSVLFGKAWMEMEPAVANQVALNKQMEIYQKILGPVTDKQLKGASDYMDRLSMMKASWQAIGLAVGEQAAPMIADAMAGITTFLMENKDKIKAGFSDAFQKIGEAGKDIDWAAVGAGLVKLVGYIPTVVNAFAWVVDNIGLVASAFAGVKIIGFLGQIGAIGPIMTRLGTVFKVLGSGLKYVGPLVMNLGRFFLGGLGGALARVGPLLMRIPFMFGPIGIAIGVVIAAGVALYQNWDTVKAYAISLWNTLVGAWDGINAATGGFLSKMMAAAQSIINLVFAPVKAGVRLLSGDWEGALNIMKSAWSGVLSSMSGLASSIWAGIKNIFTSGVNHIIDKINGALSYYNSVAPSFMSVDPLSRVGAANNRAAGSAAGRQGLQVGVTINGEVKGASIQPSVRTSQTAKPRGYNGPAGGRS